MNRRIRTTSHRDALNAAVATLAAVACGLLIAETAHATGNSEPPPVHTASPAPVTLTAHPSAASDARAAAGALAGAVSGSTSTARVGDVAGGSATAAGGTASTGPVNANSSASNSSTTGASTSGSTITDTSSSTSRAWGLALPAPVMAAPLPSARDCVGSSSDAVAGGWNFISHGAARQGVIVECMVAQQVIVLREACQFDAANKLQARLVGKLIDFTVEPAADVNLTDEQCRARKAPPVITPIVFEPRPMEPVIAATARPVPAAKPTRRAAVKPAACCSSPAACCANPAAKVVQR